MVVLAQDVLLDLHHAPLGQAGRMGMGGAQAIMVVIIAMAMLMAMGRLLIRMGMMLVVVIMVVILIKIMLVVMIMLVAMRMSMFLARPVAMGMAMRVMVRMLMAMSMLMSLVLLLALDTGLALAATADSTHLFHLQLFDSKLFAVGDADTVAATGGTGVEPLAHGHRLVALQTDPLPRDLDDLELGALRQAPPDHGVETEAQGLRLYPRQRPDLQPDPFDALEALAAGLLFQDLEDPLANRHLMHGGWRGWGLVDRKRKWPRLSPRTATAVSWAWRMIRARIIVSPRLAGLDFPRVPGSKPQNHSALAGPTG